jgi:hypothetical protein
MILLKPWLKVSVRQQWDQTTSIVGTDYYARMELWITLRHKQSKVILGRNCWANFIWAHQSKDGPKMQQWH